MINFLLGVVIAFMSLGHLEKYGGVTILPTVVAMATISGRVLDEVGTARRSELRDSDRDADRSPPGRPRR